MVKKLLLFLPFLLLTSVNANKFCYYDNFNLFCNEDGKYQQSFSQLIIKPKIIESSSSLSSSSIISDSLSSSSENNEPQTLTCPDYYTDESGINFCYEKPVYDIENNTCTYTIKEIQSSEDPCKIGTCDPDTSEIVYKNNPVYCFVPEDKNDTVIVDNETINVKIEFNEIEPCKNVNSTCVTTLYNATCIPYKDDYECEWSWSDKECKCVKKKIDLKSTCEDEYIINITDRYYEGSMYIERTKNNTECLEKKYNIYFNYASSNACRAHFHWEQDETIITKTFPIPRYCPKLESKIYNYTIPNSTYVKVFVSYSNITECAQYQYLGCIPATYTTHCSSLDPNYVCHPMANNESNYNPEYPCSCDLINVIEDCPTYIDEDDEINLCYTPNIDNGICRYTYKESYEKNGLIFACNPETGDYENISATTTITLTPGYLVSNNTNIKTRDIGISKRNEKIKKRAFKKRAKVVKGVGNGNHKLTKVVKCARRRHNQITLRKGNVLPKLGKEQKINNFIYKISNSAKNIESAINNTLDRIDSVQLLVVRFDTTIEQYINDTLEYFINNITNSSGSLEYNNEIYNEILNNIVEFINNVTNISLSELEQANNLTKRQMEIIKDQINDLEDNLKQLFRKPIYESILQQALSYADDMKKLQDNTATEISQELNIVKESVTEMCENVTRICTSVEDIPLVELADKSAAELDGKLQQTGTDEKQELKQMQEGDELSQVLTTEELKKMNEVMKGKIVNAMYKTEAVVEETNKYILTKLDYMKNITIRTNVEFSKQSNKLASFVKKKGTAALKKGQGLAAAADRVYTGEVSGKLTEVEVLDIKDSSHLITERLYRAIEPITFESRARHMVREYAEIPDEIINLWIMHKNIEGEYNIGNADSDDSNYFIVPSDSSIACFYYNDNHYCIDKELIHYTYDDKDELIAKIYYEDLDINNVTDSCPVTVISIDK